MSDEKILTKEIIDKCLSDNLGYLAEFTMVEDAVAENLSKYRGGLYLNSLRRLSDVVAEGLSQNQGDLSLDGLTSLSDAAAESLGKHDGDLYLRGLAHLSDAAAESLSRNQGRLFLKGLISLSDAAAESLSKHHGSLFLSGLTSLSDGAAASFSKHQGDLSLDGLTNLSDAAAKCLTKHEGTISLYGLEALSDSAAMSLANSGCDLGLNLDHLPESAATILSKHHSFAHILDDEFIDEDDGDDWQEEDQCKGSEMLRLGNSASIAAFVKKQNEGLMTGDWLRDPEGTLINSVGMKLVPIQPGEFQMGDPGCDEGENLCHPVRITQKYYIGMFAVTQGEYFSVTGRNPSYFLGKNRPVEQLSWQDAKEFCELLTQLPAEEAAGRRYRLPSEAEWEYACRAGTETEFFFGSREDPDKANFSEHGGQVSPQPTLPVGCFLPNQWGLYDTHGNVWEWCSDWFDDEFFRESPHEDPVGPEIGDHHALRGGAASNAAYECSSYMRGEASQCDGPSPKVPAYGRFEALGDFGMRVVCEVDD